MTHLQQQGPTNPPTARSIAIVPDTTLAQVLAVLGQSAIIDSSSRPLQPVFYVSLTNNYYQGGTQTLVNGSTVDSVTASVQAQRPVSSASKWWWSCLKFIFFEATDFLKKFWIP